MGQLVAGFSARRPVFNFGPFPVKFAVENVVAGQVFVLVLRFWPVSDIPSMLHTFHFSTTVTRRTNERSLGTFNRMLFRILESIDRKVLSHECQSSKVKLCHDLFHRDFSFLLLSVTLTFVFSSINILFLESIAVRRKEGLKNLRTIVPSKEIPSC